MATSRNESVIRARELRRNMSLPEGLLWQALRKRPGGFKFRHQHPLGPYTLDFYCAAGRLAIEVDGVCHNMGDNPLRDARRDVYLRRQGLRVLRFDAVDVLRHIDSVIRLILDELSVPPHRKAMGRGTTRRVVEG